MKTMANVGVMGAGSWGTALALLLHKNGHQVTVWSINQEEVDMLSSKREHTSKLPGVKLPEEMIFTSNMEEAIVGKDFLVLAVPSPFTRSTARNMKPYVKEGQIIVDVAKGIEEATLMTLSQQIEEELPQADVAVLSGPSHAEEVGRKLPKPRAAHHLRGRGPQKGDGRISSEHVYERGVPCLYKSGYAGNGAWRFLKECHRFGCRNCRRHGIWRQYEGCSDYQRNCRDCKTGCEDGRSHRKLYRSDGNRRSDCNLCQRS